MHPQFISGAKGNLFALHRDPDAPSPSGTVIIVPPFGEEMNRTRIVMTRVAEDIARAGYHSIAFDLSGTGDSAGDLDDTRWSDWLQDLTTLIDWSTAEHKQPISLLGIRLGGLLAAEISKNRPCQKLILWNAVTDGSAYISHLQRIARVTKFNERENGASQNKKRPELGRGLTVLGYTLNRGLIDDISKAHLNVFNDVSTLHLDSPTPPYWALEAPVSMSGLIDETIRFLKALSVVI